MVKKTGRSFDEKGAFMSKQTPEPFDNRQPVAFSRRTFLLGSLAGAASLLLEPLWQDGDRFAYAADAANPEFKVFVVSNKEIGIATMDVTGNKNVPLPGAKITLAKYSDSKKTLSGTTDEDGNIVFNIETFGDVITLSDGEKVYQFDGSIDIVKDGYRRVSIKRIRCAGGSGMKVPTRLTTTTWTSSRCRSTTGTSSTRRTRSCASRTWRPRTTLPGRSRPRAKARQRSPLWAKTTRPAQSTPHAAST